MHVDHAFVKTDDSLAQLGAEIKPRISLDYKGRLSCEGRRNPREYVIGNHSVEDQRAACSPVRREALSTVHVELRRDAERIDLFDPLAWVDILALLGRRIPVTGLEQVVRVLLVEDDAVVNLLLGLLRLTWFGFVLFINPLEVALTVLCVQTRFFGASLCREHLLYH